MPAASDGHPDRLTGEKPSLSGGSGPALRRLRLIGAGLTFVHHRVAMAILRAVVMLGVLTVVLPFPAHARSVKGPIPLIQPLRLSKAASAMPRLRDAASPAARRINAALDAADRRLRGAISDCAGQAHDAGARGAEYDRTVSVAMSGPAFLSVVASDSGFCGGLHPNFQTIALTFDLQTGRPVDWSRLLPAPLIETTTTEGAMDGAIMGLVRSKLLVELDTDPSEDCGIPEDAAFQLWPDAVRGGVSVAWADPPHADMNCGEPALLDVATLRRYGASPVLIQALIQAQGAAKRGHP